MPQTQMKLKNIAGNSPPFHLPQGYCFLVLIYVFELYAFSIYQGGWQKRTTKAVSKDFIQLELRVMLKKSKNFTPYEFIMYIIIMYINIFMHASLCTHWSIFRKGNNIENQQKCDSSYANFTKNSTLRVTLHLH